MRRGEKKLLEGSFGVCRSSDGNIYLRIRDELSGMDFVEIKMTPEQFALGITGLHGTKCELDVRGTEFLGMQHEVKQVMVVTGSEDVDTYSREKMTDELWSYLCTEHEIDGWTVDRSGWANHHKLIPVKDLPEGAVAGFYCNAHRWVKV